MSDADLIARLQREAKTWAGAWEPSPIEKLLTEAAAALEAAEGLDTRMCGAGLHNIRFVYFDGVIRCAVCQLEAAEKRAAEDAERIKARPSVTIDMAADEREEWRAKLEAAETDAGRYRWLREAGCNIRDEDGPAEWYEGAEMDAAIDAAMRSDKP